MKSFTLEQIAQITGGLLSKVQDVAVTNIASYAGYFAIMIGAMASIFNLIMIGIICEFVIFAFL